MQQGRNLLQRFQRSFFLCFRRYNDDLPHEDFLVVQSVRCLVDQKSTEAGARLLQGLNLRSAILSHCAAYSAMSTHFCRTSS
jgi:hypothetical protein